MNKTFKDLNVQEQVDFINSQLNKDSSISVTKLCKKFGLNKNTVVSRLTKSGFKYNTATRKYIKDDTLVLQDKIKDNKKELKHKSIEESTINNELKELLKYKDDIIKLINEHKENDLILEKEMIIDNKLVGGKTTNHNFKVYTSVKNEIQELQKKYPQFRMLDLVSTAIHEYCLKYLKK